MKQNLALFLIFLISVSNTFTVYNTKKPKNLKSSIGSGSSGKKAEAAKQVLSNFSDYDTIETSDDGIIVDVDKNNIFVDEIIFTGQINYAPTQSSTAYTKIKALDYELLNESKSRALARATFTYVIPGVKVDYPANLNNIKTYISLRLLLNNKPIGYYHLENNSQSVPNPSDEVNNIIIKGTAYNLQPGKVYKVSIEAVSYFPLITIGAPRFQETTLIIEGEYIDNGASEKFLISPEKMTGEKPIPLQKSMGSIFIGVDDIIHSITVNGEPIPLLNFHTQAEIQNWLSPKVFKALMGEGDTIVFDVQDWGGLAALYATIEYRTNSGILNQITTGAGQGWSCNGSTDVNLEDHTWYKSNISRVDSLGVLIWDKKIRVGRIQCQVTLPYVKSTDVMYYSVNNFAPLVRVYDQVDYRDITVSIPEGKGMAPLRDNISQILAGTFKIWDQGYYHSFAGPEQGGYKEKYIQFDFKNEESIDTIEYETAISATCEISFKIEKNVGIDGTKTLVEKKEIQSDNQYIYYQIKETKIKNIRLTISNSCSPFALRRFVFIRNYALNTRNIPNNKEWRAVKQIDLAFKSGQTVEIEGINEGAYNSNSNPFGMIAAIYYTNKNGKKSVISTGPQWVCDNQPAAVYQKNNDVTSPFFKNKKTKMQKIPESANWIWNPSFADQQKWCKVVLP